MVFRSIPAAIVLVHVTTIFGLGLGRHQFIPQLLTVAALVVFTFNLDLSGFSDYGQNGVRNYLIIVLLALHALKAIDDICITNVCQCSASATDNLGVYYIYTKDRKDRLKRMEAIEYCRKCVNIGDDFRKVWWGFNFMWNFRGIGTKWETKDVWAISSGEDASNAHLQRNTNQGQDTEPEPSEVESDHSNAGVFETERGQTIRVKNIIHLKSESEAIKHAAEGLIEDDKSALIPEGPFVLRKLASIIICLVNLEFSTTLFPARMDLMTREHIKIISRLSQITFEEIAFRITFVLMFWTSLASIIWIAYDATGFVLVSCGLHDTNAWPPIFGPLQEAYCLRNFWGYSLLRLLALSVC